MPPRSAAAESKSSGSGSGSGPGSRPEPIAAKLRRAHRKSRNGCYECKRRHIKCDESRPSCSNCVVSERSCAYPTSAANNAAAAAPTPAAATATPSPVPSHSQPPSAPSRTNTSNASHSQAQSPADSISSPGTLHRPPSAPPPSFFGSRFDFPMIVDDRAPPPTTLPSFTDGFAANFADSPSTSSLPDALPQPIFTAKHLILLHHASTAMPLTNNLLSPVVEIAVEWSQDAPYAMDQLLAISADHFAILQPEKAISHRRTATELQTRALMWFNKDSQELNNGNIDPEKICIPRFLFASLLSIHMIYETFTHYRANFHAFVERFVESVHLHRGVRTVIQTGYDTIADSSLRPFLANIRTASESDNVGSECLELVHLIQNSDLGPAAVAACNSAAHSLQWAFNVHRNLPHDGNVHAATAFPVLLTAEYVDAVRKHRPEALLVLAYYGVLLHRCRNAWIIGDAGAFLIRLIADHLGSFWQEPMRWPLEELARDQG